MKKVSIIALVCIFMLGCALAAEYPSKLEMDTYQEKLLKNAIQDGQYDAATEEKGGFVLYFSGYALQTDSDTLTVNTQINGLILTEEEEGEIVRDVRGVGVGDTLEQVLNAYPMMNETLNGTREEAVLYIEGELPGQVQIGCLFRDGQNIDRIVHSVYSMVNGGVKVQTICYTFDGDAVCQVKYDFAGSVITLQQAQTQVDECWDNFEAAEYSSSVRDEGSKEAFGRDDLIVSGIDLYNLTPDEAQSLLGDDYAEEWLNDEDCIYYVMEWNAASMIFQYDINRNFQGLIEFYMDENLLEGPRGICIGDEQTSVISAFRCDAEKVDEATSFLYGSGDEPESAAAYFYAEGQGNIYYAFEEDDISAGMELDFVDARLSQIIIIIN